ncbi:serine/threonine-protein kinase [Mycolicibacterium sp. XJ1819]
MSDTGGEGRVGTQIGPYRLWRLLGRGGMGEVYEAEDTVKDRTVALKLLPESASHDPVFRKRLQREAHSAGRLQEPHVVPIHDYGEIDGLLFVDMRMIEGTDLRKMVKQDGPLTPARAVAIVRQIASALDAAHQSGVTHRDVKPENIIITGDDFAYLVDFGIANAATDEKLTDLGTAVGTYAYMAPERFTKDEVTYRADIYALACVLYECLTGSQPFPGDSVSVVITAHLMQPPPRPSAQHPGIPAAFDDVIARGMAKDPQDRYTSAGDLALAAHAALTHRDQDRAATILERSAPPAPMWMPPPPPKPPGFPWTALVAAAAVFVLALGALGAFFVVKRDDGVSSSGSATSTRTAAPTPRRSTPDTTPARFDSRLMALLPRGYADGVCKPAHPPASGALATVDCGPASRGGGPQSARYSLFADQQALDGAFDQSAAANSTLTQCPGSGVDSPTTWHYTDTPDKVEGRIACGVFNDRQDVTWTKNADLLLGDAQGTNLEGLHSWWLEFG